MPDQGVNGLEMVCESFRAADADVVLVSSDGVGFLVHRANLEVHSKLFKDMFEVGRDAKSGAGELPRVELEEDSSVLELVLTYVYPGRIKAVFDDFPALWKPIKALHKYELDRGLEAVESELSRRLSSPSPKKLDFCLAVFFFSTEMSAKTLREDAIGHIIALNPETQLVQNTTRDVSCPFNSSVEESTKLALFLEQRRGKIAEFRRSEMADLAKDLQIRDSVNNYGHTVAAMMEMWQLASDCLSRDALDDLAAKKADRLEQATGRVDFGAYPPQPFRDLWWRYKCLLRELPTSY